MSDKVFIRGLLVFLVVTFVLWVITYNMYERRGDEIEHLKEQHKYMLQSFKEAADVYCKAVIATNLDEMECLSQMTAEYRTTWDKTRNLTQETCLQHKVKQSVWPPEDL